jgi:beta-amylase
VKLFFKITNKWVKTTIITTLLLLLPLFSLAHAGVDVDVMGPLIIGDPFQINDEISVKEWNEFESRLKTLKSYGVEGVTIDIWWGVVHSGPKSYNWEYYDKIDEVVKRVGMKWVPIFSFHQLGDNVNDPKRITLPSHVLALAQTKGYLYKDVNGRENYEAVSVWATEKVLYLYKEFFSEFYKHFEGRTDAIKQIYIGLGSAGELRYTSYNKDTYPGHGDLWAYSGLAIEAFRDFVLEKYNGDLSKVARSWGINSINRENIYPPMEGESFFTNGQHLTQYGKDFFDFYHQSLIKHMKLLVGAGLEVFRAEGSSLMKVPLSVKVPGVHWTVGAEGSGKRLAELVAGLVPSSSPYFLNPSEEGAGYDELFRQVKSMASDMVLDFTCIEKSDYDDSKANTMPKSLSRWIIATAKRNGLKLEGENALPSFGAPDFWKNINDALMSGYEEITILRMDDIFNEANRKIALDGIRDITKPFFMSMDLSAEELAIISFLEADKLDKLQTLEVAQRKRVIVDMAMEKMQEQRVYGYNLSDIVISNMDMLFGSGDLVNQYLRMFVYGADNYEDRRSNIRTISEYVFISKWLLDAGNTKLLPYKEKILSLDNRIKYAETWVTRSPKVDILKKYYIKYMLEFKGIKLDKDLNMLEALIDLKMDIFNNIEEIIKTETGKNLLFGTEKENGMDGVLYYMFNNAELIQETTMKEVAEYQNMIIGLEVLRVIQDKEIKSRTVPELTYVVRLNAKAETIERYYRDKAELSESKDKEYFEAKRKEVEKLRVKTTRYIRERM